MRKFKFKGKNYEYPDGWQDVTVQTYLDYLVQVEAKTPAALRELWAANDKERTKILQGITKQQYALEFVPFFVRYVCFWCEMSTNTAQSMNLDTLEAMYRQIETNLARSLEKVDKSTNVIEFAEELWYLPAQFMQGSTVIEFMEAAQFEHVADKIIGGQMTALPDIMCVLLRKKGEAYHQDLMKRRGLFLTMTMDNAFVVAFFLLQLSAKYAANFQAYTIASQMHSLIKQVSKN